MAKEIGKASGGRSLTYTDSMLSASCQKSEATVENVLQPGSKRVLRRDSQEKPRKTRKRINDAEVLSV